MPQSLARHSSSIVRPDSLVPRDGCFRSRGFDFLETAGQNTLPLGRWMCRRLREWPKLTKGWFRPARKYRPPLSKNPVYHLPLRDSEDVQFILVGDTGMNSPGEYLVSSAISRSDLFPSDFALLLGDIIYPAGSEVDYRYGLLEAFKHYPKPILAVPGNHDWYDDLKAYERFFITGSQPVSSRNAWMQSYDWQSPGLPNWYYSLDIGRSLRLICLDTGPDGALAANRQAQLDWLDALLARSADKFLVVMMHHPLYSLSGRSHERALRAALLERFHKANVRAVFSGHDHNYQRHTVEGMAHVISGAGGATLQPLPSRRKVSGREGRPQVLQNPAGVGWDQHHSFIHCHWKHNALTCTVWSAHQLPPTPGSLLDRFTLRLDDTHQKSWTEPRPVASQGVPS